MAHPQPFFLKRHGKLGSMTAGSMSGIVFVNRNGLRWRDVPTAAVRTRRCAIGGGGTASEACTRAVAGRTAADAKSRTVVIVNRRGILAVHRRQH